MSKKDEILNEEELEDYEAVSDIENEEDEETYVEESTKDNKNKKPAKLNPFQQAIKDYLDDYASMDEVFNERYLNPEKNIVDCCNYICNQVKASGRQGFADEEVFKMARDYYVDEVSKEDLNKLGGKVVVNHTIELTEQEKEKARLEAIKRLEEEILKEERKKREDEAKAQAKAEEKAAKKEAERIRKEEEKKKIEEDKKAQELANAKNNGGGEQMSLFDL